MVVTNRDTAPGRLTGTRSTPLSNILRPRIEHSHESSRAGPSLKGPRNASNDISKIWVNGAKRAKNETGGPMDRPISEFFHRRQAATAVFAFSI